MAWVYGFHNSVNGDRVYNADHLSGIFDGLISAGVYQSVGNKLAVQPSSGMVIQIGTGRGWFNGRWVNNSTPYLITLANSDVTLNRYAAICVRGNNNSGVRTTVPYVKYSEFATNPAKPTMERTNEVKEYCLAYVYIKAGAAAILASNIEDTRQDKNLCGWVTGLVDQITPDTLYSQFTAQFNEWFSTIQDDIDANTKTMLVAALPKGVTISLPVAGWVLNGSVYKQSASITGMNNSKSVIVAPSSTTVTAYNDAAVKAVLQETNKITFSANKVPTEAISVDILFMGQ